MTSNVTHQLRALLAVPATPMAEITALLDGADDGARKAALFALSAREQHALYDRAQDAAPWTLDDLVPTTTAPLQPVVHHGKNSLPLFREFQKVVCRPDDGSPRVFGFNEGFTRAFIGPGYFVAKNTGLPSDGDASWAARGGVVVDYFEVPDGAVAPGWPAVKKNSQGLQRFVFHGMRDYLRRVSTHACIGSAFQGEKDFKSWFILCRDG